VAITDKGHHRGINMNSYVLFEGNGLSLELDEAEEGDSFHLSMRLRGTSDNTVIHGAVVGSKRHSRLSTANSHHTFSPEELRQIAARILEIADGLNEGPG
jgi:hypothetical protein